MYSEITKPDGERALRVTSVERIDATIRYATEPVPVTDCKSMARILENCVREQLHAFDDPMSEPLQQAADF